MTSPSIVSIHLRLLGMAALWGGAWPLGRLTGQYMQPLTASGLRFVIAGAVLLVWLYRYNRFRTVRVLNKRQWLNLTLASATGVLGYASFFMLALQFVPAGKASIIVTLNPAVTLLMAAVVFHERLNGKIALGMLLAAVGATLAITDGRPLSFIHDGVNAGGFLLLGCVACWVAYTLIGRAVLTGIDALTTTTVTSVLGAGMLVTTSLLAEGPATWAALPDAPASAWISLLVLAFASTALAYAWYFDGVKAIGAGAASGYITLVPVFGLFFSGVLLGERLGISLLFGGLIAVTGMALMHFGRQTRP